MLQPEEAEGLPKVENISEKNERPLLLRASSSSSSITSIGTVTSNTSTSSIRSKNYFCEYNDCHKSFTRPSLLTNHQQSVHQGIRPFQCDTCPKAFIKKSHLERHLISHSTEKPFHCSFCNKGVTTQQQLKRHEITHTKSFKCEYEGCNESFYKHPQLRSHILSFHLKKLVCKICNKNFQRPYRLNNHLIKHHNLSTNEEISNIDNLPKDVYLPYACKFPSCSQSFKNWSLLQSHIKNDHPKLKCPLCDKLCVDESGLQMHMIVHDESLVIKNWKCDICSKDSIVSFAKKIDLIDHLKNCHDQELEYENNEMMSLNINTNVNSDTNTESNATDIETSKIPDNNELMNMKPISNDNNNNILQKITKKKISEPTLLKSQLKLEHFFKEGGSSKELILTSAGKKFKCTFEKCYRTFKTKERWKKHIDGHKMNLLRLKILEEKSNENDNKENQSTITL